MLASAPERECSAVNALLQVQQQNQIIHYTTKRVPMRLLTVNSEQHRDAGRVRDATRCSAGRIRNGMHSTRRPGPPLAHPSPACVRFSATDDT